MKKTLFLIDAMALIYRSYYALNKSPRMNSKGLNTSAILGFVNTIDDLLRKQKPTHIGVAFDLQGPTFRHEMYKEYKANRDAMPEDIQCSIPIIKELLKAWRIPILSREGFEADDVIGTLASKAAKNGYEVYMVTPDKDFAQLVSESIFIYKLGRMGKGDEILKVPQVLERFQIKRTEQVKDILGLWGDGSDNIPGIPGIGEKKAIALIAKYDSVENLIKEVESIDNSKLKELIRVHAEQALFSKSLATIEMNVPIDFDEPLLERKTPDIQSLKALFEELEFRTFAKRFFSDPLFREEGLSVKTKFTPSTDQFSLFDTPKEPNQLIEDGAVIQPFKEYKILNTLEGVQQWIQELEGASAFSFFSLFDKTTRELRAIAFSKEPHRAVYIPLQENPEKIFSLIRPLFRNESIRKIFFDLKQEMALLSNWEIQVHQPYADMMLAHYLLEPESRHRIEVITEVYLSVSLLEEENLIGKQVKSKPVPYTLVQIEQLKNYVAERADALIQLDPVLIKQLEERSLDSLFYEVEIPLIKVLYCMEREGVRIDVAYLNQYSKELQKEKQLIEKRIYSEAGEEFNISSPKQLGEILFAKMKIIDKPSITPSKQFSTAEEVLQKLEKEHQIVRDVLEYRSLSKLIGTYLDAFPSLISSQTNRLHTTYNQAVTATGRLSSNSPNLQNIPIRTDRGREIRKAFIPRDEDHILIAADYSQIELRIIASLSKDRHLMEAFVNGEDIHTATASRIFKIPLDQVSKEMRRKAKSVNFGIIYGISAFGLSEQLHIPRKEASELISEYFLQYPDIENYIKANIAFAREHQYVKTILGRRRYLSEINSRNMNLRTFAERNAVNMPIQGSAADMIKIAMIHIFEEFARRDLKSKMILQVHDELLFDVPASELEVVKEIILEKMKEALPLLVPIEVDLGVGKNWLEAH